MNLKIASERKSDGKILYFFDNASMEKYIENNGGQDAYDFLGFQIVPDGEKVIDTDEFRSDFMFIASGLGININELKEHEIYGTDDPEKVEETEEMKMKRIEEDLKNRVAVYRIKDNGQLEETNEDVDEIVKAKKERHAELTISVLEKKCIELNIDLDDFADYTGYDRINKLADVIWETKQKM